MTVNIRVHKSTSTCKSYRWYDVIVDDTTKIATMVTHDPFRVRHWIENMEYAYDWQLDRIIVGLTCEWNRVGVSELTHESPVATLQLCIRNDCLIYQIIHGIPQGIPRVLRKFLSNETYKFVGVGIDEYVKKLQNDYGFEVSNAVDLGHWAAVKLGKENLVDAGLKDLVKEIAGQEIEEKPENVSVSSSWDQRWLSHDQIYYACLDAYLSAEVGRLLTPS